MATTTKPKKETVKKKVEAKADKPSRAAVTEAKRQVKEEMKGKMSDLILTNWDSLVEGFGTFSASKQWDIALQMMPYITPKMQSSEINADVKSDPLASQLGQLANTRITTTQGVDSFLGLDDTNNTPSS